MLFLTFDTILNGNCNHLLWKYYLYNNWFGKKPLYLCNIFIKPIISCDSAHYWDNGEYYDVLSQKLNHLIINYFMYICYNNLSNTSILSASLLLFYLNKNISKLTLILKPSCNSRYLLMPVSKTPGFNANIFIKVKLI